MKQFIKHILIKFSRLIFYLLRIVYWITPIEYRKANTSNLEKKLNDNLVDETLSTFKEYFKKTLIFKDLWEIRLYAIKSSILNDKDKKFYSLEFGTWEGKSANFFSKHIKKLYVFDSFEGLIEDWKGTNTPLGAFNLQKKIPRLNSNIEPIVGLIEDQLDDFLKKHNPKINFVHIDVDTYKTSKFILGKIKPYLVKNSIIIFDELYNYIGRKDGEYKALKEVFNDQEFEFIAFCITGQQCVIKIK